MCLWAALVLDAGGEQVCLSWVLVFKACPSDQQSSCEHLQAIISWYTLILITEQTQCRYKSCTEMHVASQAFRLQMHCKVVTSALLLVSPFPRSCLPFLSCPSSLLPSFLSSCFAAYLLAYLLCSRFDKDPFSYLGPTTSIRFGYQPYQMSFWCHWLFWYLAPSILTVCSFWKV